MKVTITLVFLVCYLSCGAAGETTAASNGSSSQHSSTEELPQEQCDPWYPKIVPRRPTSSPENNTPSGENGVSRDPESRNNNHHSAMATSRPRRLHHTFLQYQLLLSRMPEPLASLPEGAIESLMNTQYSIENSWIVTSAPINFPKYSLLAGDSDDDSGYPMHIPLSTPNTNEDGQLPNMYRTYVNYGENHPFEGAQIISGATFQPLRIAFHTDNLPVTPGTLAKVESLTADILPSVSGIWASALSVVRAVDNIFISSTGTCGEVEIPSSHSNEGIANADILIYVTANGPQCYNVEGNNAGINSYASVCSFDQHMRPVTGNLVICLDQIDASRMEVFGQEVLRITNAITMEVGKILGLSPSLFEYFRDPRTGKSWGTTKKTVTCVDGSEKTLALPNMLQSSLDNDDSMRNVEVDPYFEVVSPTVRQVVRNHFDCQTLRGARLSRQSPSTCFGDTFDSRYHFDEDLTPSGFFADMAYSLSPLTLALLEDSSWYKADFSKSTTPLFGRGAGCGFVDSDCLTESGNILGFSSGFFCNDSRRDNSVETPQPSGCDYTHNHKADCNLCFGGSDSAEQDGGASCSMRTANIVACSDEANFATLQGEKFSMNSRCFETSISNSICLESYCNSVDMKIDIVVNGKDFQCDYEGQELDLGFVYNLRCPRLAVVCPHLVCPASCSGKGVCDYCQEVPQCVCDDSFDETPGCWGSSV